MREGWQPRWDLVNQRVGCLGGIHATAGTEEPVGFHPGSSTHGCRL
jgi:hypothetical protein